MNRGNNYRLIVAPIFCSTNVANNPILNELQLFEYKYYNLEKK